MGKTFVNGGCRSSKNTHSLKAFSKYTVEKSCRNLKSICMCFILQFSALHYSPDSVNFAATACDRISDFLSSTNAYVKGNWGMGRISESDLLQVI